MVKLDADLPLPMPVEQLLIKPQYEALLAAVEQCEFKSLLREIQTEAAAAGKAVKDGAQGELIF